MSRIMSLSENCIVERDPATYQVATLRPLCDVSCLWVGEREGGGREGKQRRGKKKEGLIRGPLGEGKETGKRREEESLFSNLIPKPRYGKVDGE